MLHLKTEPSPKKLSYYPLLQRFHLRHLIPVYGCCKLSEKSRQENPGYDLFIRGLNFNKVIKQTDLRWNLQFLSQAVTPYFHTPYRNVHQLCDFFCG